MPVTDRDDIALKAPFSRLDEVREALRIPRTIEQTAAHSPC